MKECKVFFVDDHASLRDALAKDLHSTREFCSVGVASDGREAIRLLKDGLEADIVLLDLNMDGLSGYEVADWIAENRPSLKMLVMTMGVDSSKMIKLLNAGISGIVKKQILPDELVIALKTVMRGEQYFGSDVTLQMAEAYRLNDARLIREKRLGLTERDLQYLKLCCTDMVSKEIADQMGISVHAVKALQVRLCRILNVPNRFGLMMFAVYEGYVQRKQ